MLTKHRKYRGRHSYNNSRPSRLGAGPSAETAELARARRRRSWPEIGDAGTGPVPGDVGALPELGDGVAVKDSESAELVRGSEMVEPARSRRRRSWP